MSIIAIVFIDHRGRSRKNPDCPKDFDSLTYEVASSFRLDLLVDIEDEFRKSSVVVDTSECYLYHACTFLVMDNFSY